MGDDPNDVIFAAISDLSTEHRWREGGQSQICRAITGALLPLSKIITALRDTDTKPLCDTFTQIPHECLLA